jgi:hypothetical protein
MNESKETKKTRNITFRLTNEQYQQVENAALAAGEDPNSWCRKVALIQLTEGFGLTKNDRLLYEEIARVRYLVGHGFRLTLGLSESHGCNVEENHGGRRSEFGDNRRRLVIEEEISVWGAGRFL